MCQPESNNLLGNASCWIQQLAALLVLQLTGFSNLHAQANCWIQVDTFIWRWPIKKINVSTCWSLAKGWSEKNEQNIPAVKFWTLPTSSWDPLRSFSFFVDVDFCASESISGAVRCQDRFFLTMSCIALDLELSVLQISLLISQSNINVSTWIQQLAWVCKLLDSGWPIYTTLTY